VGNGESAGVQDHQGMVLDECAGFGVGHYDGGSVGVVAGDGKAEVMDKTIGFGEGERVGD